MQINELNAYSVDGSSALGKSPPIWTPETGCFLLSHADNPRTKRSLVNYSFTRLLFVLAGHPELCPSLSGPSLAVRRGFYPNPRNAPCIKWLHAGYAILYLKIRVPECPFNEPLHCKCNLSFRHVQVISLKSIYALFLVFATGSEVAQ